jgi:integrase
MSVRKRAWRNRDGSQSESWIVNYTDQGGTRRMKSFDRKRDADAFHATVNVDVRRGLHVPDSQSIFVAEAARLWLESSAHLERTTRVQYRQHVNLHIVPLLGAAKISQLSVPMVRAFEDKLAADRSPIMVRKVLTSLGSILADAQERGLVAQNVVRGLRSHRRGKDATRRRGKAADRRRKLKAGVDIPTPDEIRAIVARLDKDTRWRPLLLTAIFTGLRASELRGLPWSDIDLRRGELHVRQRADRYGKIGSPKSEAGERVVPLPPMLVNVLRAWKLACPKSNLDLVFPNNRGGVEKLSNIVERGLIPIGIAAGIVTPAGKAKYSGLHTLRHFFASWCINRKADGGLELPAKMVQERMGHASITMTMDVYGHLFPRKDDSAELAAAERALVMHSVGSRT